MTAVDDLRAAGDRTAARRYSLAWPGHGPRAVLAAGLLILRILAAALTLARNPQSLALFGAVTALLVAGNAGVLVTMAVRGWSAPPGLAFVVDVLVAYAAKLVGGGYDVVPNGPYWLYLTATVALWTVLFGVPAGLLSGGGWYLVQAVGTPLDERTPAGTLFAQTVLLGVGLFAALVSVSVSQAVSGSAAWSAAFRAGRRRERRELNRWLHDGVVQTLETIALVAGHRGATPEALEEIRELAATNARALRRTIATDGTPEPARPLSETLADLAAAAQVTGLRVDLVVGPVPDDLPVERVAALRDAAGEALRNVLKHAGTDTARMHAGVDDAAVRVEVADAGAGFDPGGHSEGFGLRQSVAARLREVGGGAEVHSRCGEGTRVVMWIPR